MYKNIGLLLGLCTVGSIFAADPLAHEPPVKRRCTANGILASESSVVAMPVEVSEQEKEKVARRLNKHSVVCKNMLEDSQVCFSNMNTTEKNVHVYNLVMDYALDTAEAPAADNEYESTQEALIHSLQAFEDYLAEQQDAKKRYISMNRGLESLQQILLKAEGDNEKSIIESCESYIGQLQNTDKEKMIVALLKAANYLDISCILDVSARHAASHYRDLFFHDHPKVFEYKLNQSNINFELQQLMSAHLLQEHTCALSEFKQQQQCNGHADFVNSVGFNHDGSQVVSGSDDRTVRIWDARTGQALQECNGHTGWINAVAFNHDGSQVVSGSDDGTVRMWNARTGEQLQQCNGHTGWVNSVAFNCNGSQVVSGSRDGTVSIWDARTGQRLQQCNGHTDAVNGVGFNHDGSQVVSGSADGTVRIWDARTGQELCQWNDRTDWVSSVGFNHDGSQVVAGSDDGTVRIWDARTGQQLQQCNGHTDGVNGVGFNHDGSQVVSGSSDTIYIWDAQTGEQLHQCESYIRGVNEVAFNNDGSQVVSGSSDNTVRVWGFTGYDQKVQSLSLLEALYVDAQLSGDKLSEDSYLNELHNSLPDNIKRIL